METEEEVVQFASRFSMRIIFTIRCNFLLPLWKKRMSHDYRPSIKDHLLVTEDDNTSSNYGVDLADENAKGGDDRAKSPYGLHSLALS